MEALTACECEVTWRSFTGAHVLGTLTRFPSLFRTGSSEGAVRLLTGSPPHAAWSLSLLLPLSPQVLGGTHHQASCCTGSWQFLVLLLDSPRGKSHTTVVVALGSELWTCSSWRSAMALNLLPQKVPVHSAVLAMLSPPSALLSAAVCGCDVRQFLPQLLEYLSHVPTASSHPPGPAVTSMGGMFGHDIPGYQNSSVVPTLLEDLPGVVYHKGLRQLGLQAEFDMMKKFHPLTITFSETLKAAWGFPSMLGEAGAVSGDSLDAGSRGHAQVRPEVKTTLNSASNTSVSPSSAADEVSDMQEVVQDSVVGELVESPVEDLDSVTVVPSVCDLEEQVQVPCVRGAVSGAKVQAVVRYTPTRRVSVVSNGYVMITRSTSTVAIDNKIEQAMDLVKSHLMYAVREEVEVLKEQIKELMERLSQLEMENNILRAAATPDTLAKLAPTPQPSQQPPPSSSS